MGHYCNGSTREPSFKHLTMEERAEIEAGLRHGLSPASIAREIGRAQSTVSREIRRGMGPQSAAGKLRPMYLAEAAQERYVSARWARASRKGRRPQPRAAVLGTGRAILQRDRGAGTALHC